MKTLKLDHELAGLVQKGLKSSTMRMFDDKNLSVNDVVRIIDKVDSERPETWRMIGTARIERVIEVPLGNVTEQDLEGHETYTSPDEMLTTFQKYYGNDVSLTTPVKIIYFAYNDGEQSDDVTNTMKPVQKVHLYADGGSRGNPGPSASGYVVIDPENDTVLVDKGIYLGVTTNNQAEYLALKYGLEAVQKMGAQEVDVYLDSLLVVNQMKGVFKVSNRDLWPIHGSIKELSQAFKRINYTHVPRELNKLADAAVNRALDEHMGSLKATEAPENLS